MNVTDDLFRRFSSTPYELAPRLLRAVGHHPELLRDAAIRWCNLVSALRPIPEVGWVAEAPAYALLTTASEGCEVFQMWLRAAGPDPSTPARSGDHGSYERTLIEGLLFLWSERDKPDEYAARLCAWAYAAAPRSETHTNVALSLAYALRRFPAVAYALVAIPPGRGVAADPALAMASVALFRRYEGCEPYEHDDSILAKPSAAAYLGDSALCILLRKLLTEGKAMPEHLWSEIDQMLPGQHNQTWYRALGLLAASPPRQERAVEVIADTLRSHHDPLAIFALMTEGTLSRGLFRGRGWAGTNLGRKMLPVSRVLVARGLWPTSTWVKCFERQLLEPIDGTPEVELERQYARVKAVLGEALLEVALDAAVDAPRRLRAIRSIGLLAPGGDSAGVLRALGKLYDDPLLGRAAKQAQAEARDRGRSGHLDGEVAIMDAWEHFTAANTPAENPPEVLS